MGRRPVPGGRGRLTPRQQQAITGLAHGASVKDIAAALVVTEKTVSRTLQDAYARLGVHDRYEAARWYWAGAADGPPGRDG